MDHLADDRSRPDDRHLDDEIVEALRLHARESRHLCAALDLEDADGVGLLQGAVYLGVVWRQLREVELDALVAAHQWDRFLEHGHHAEAEEIDLDDAEVRTVLLVPLDHHAPGHGCRLERHNLVEPARGDHHAARMLAEVAGQGLDLVGEPDQMAHARRVGIEPGILQLLAEAVEIIAVAVRAQAFRQPVDLRRRKAERLADLAHRAARAIGDDVGGHRRPARAVALVDVLDDPLALRRRSAGRGRCPAIRRAPRRESARTASPCRRRRPR